MTNRFENKVVVVTGAAGGIGKAACVRFASEGARVLAVDLASTDLAATVDVASQGPGECRSTTADVTVAAEVEGYIATAVELFGGVDVLFNNAGIEGQITSLLDYEEDRFDQVLEVNVQGVWRGMKYVAPVMDERGGGVIVNTASVAGLLGTPGIIAYGASKHAVVGMTKTAAIELAPMGIRVCAVCPSPIETQMMRTLEKGRGGDDPEAVYEQLKTTMPLGRYGEPEEVAAFVAFLSSDEASYLTGAAFPIDGGRMTR